MLTESEFLALNSGEQDALIYEHVFGHERQEGMFTHWCLAQDGDSQAKPHSYLSRYPEWRYSTSLADVWTVVEKMQSDGFSCAIELDHGEQPWVIFHKPEEPAGGTEGVGESASIPLAICLAALKAKGVIE